MDWWGMQWVILGSFEDLMQWWLRWKFRKKQKTSLESCLHFCCLVIVEVQK
ncbi:hypothetical protein CsSME_00012491 [Camellia sinensis var. sinensis]